MFKLSGVYQNIATGVLFYGHVFPLRLICLYRCKESSVHGTNLPLFVKTLSRLYYCCTVDRFPSDLCLYKCKQFNVHGTISSVVFQNIIITAVLETRFPSPPNSACTSVKN